MKLILPDGRELPAKTLPRARVDHVIDLQLQSGLGVDRIHANMQASEAFAMAVTHYLTRRAACDEITWKQVISMELHELGEGELEPGDIGYADEPQESDADPNPLASPTGDAPAEPDDTAAQPSDSAPPSRT